MFVDYCPLLDKYGVFNNRGEVVASFATYDEAFRYAKQG